MNLSEAFSFKIAQQMARYEVTYPQASVALAVFSSDDDATQTTGLVPVFFDGDLITDIPADTQLNHLITATDESVTLWATATTYTVSTTAPVIRKDKGSTGVMLAEETRLRLIKTHTSSADNQPMVGSRWETYWVREPHDCSTSQGAVIEIDNSQQFLYLANRVGVLQLVLCGDESLTTTAANFRVPQFDPHTYCAVGLLEIAAGNTQFVMGTTEIVNSDTTGTTEFINFTGPIFPHIDLIDKK